MPEHDVIVIGASAGGVEALIELVRTLPPDLPATIFIAVHFPSNSMSVLPNILNRHSRLPARHPQDGEAIEKGWINIAPANYHLILNDGVIHLHHGPREHGFRPAIDPLFRSAARNFGPRVVGVILSGTLGDGTGGLQAIKRAGGVTVVQDPQEAIFSYLPQNAIESVEVDYVLPVSGISELIRKLAQQAVEGEGVLPMSNEQVRESEIPQMDIEGFEQGEKSNGNTVLTCPECGGVMWELEEGNLLQYRCHVGHVYSSDSFLVEQAETLEAALWTAVRALEERAALVRRLATSARQRGSAKVEKRFSAQAEEAERNANVIRQVLHSGKEFGLRMTSLNNDLVEGDEAANPAG